MEAYVRQYLIEQCKEEGYDQDDDGIYEMLRDGNTIYEDCVGSHRW